MKLTRAVRSLAQPSQPILMVLAVGDARQHRLRHVEAHLDVAGRQQRQHRPARRHHFAGAVIDLLHGAVDRAEDLAPRQPRLRRVQSRLRVAQHRRRLVEILLRAGAGLGELRGAVEGLLRIGQRGFDLGDVGLLQIVVDREQRLAGLDRVALAHRQRLHPPDFVGRDEDEIGLDPALIAGVGFVAGRKRQRQQTGRGDKGSRVHAALPVPNRLSK